MLAATAHAQEAAMPEDGASTELEAITVTATQDTSDSYSAGNSAAATRLNLALRDTPQSVTVVTRERMDDQNMQTLRDVLDKVTGVYSYGYDTERTLFLARGQVITNTLINGVPTLTSSNTDSTDATLDTAIYDRIEIVRGATGLMTGAGNPSAAINLVRKHADSREGAGSVDMSAGSWNNYRTEVDLQTPLNENGSVRGRVIGVLQEKESYMDFYSNARGLLYAVIDADLGDSTTLTVGYDHQKTAVDGTTWGWFPLYFSDGSLTNWPRSFSTAARWSYWDNTTSTVFAELKQQLGNDWLLNATAQHRNTTGNSRLFFMDYYYDATDNPDANFPDRTTGLGLAPASNGYVDSSEQNAVDIYASGPFQFLGRRHELVVGAIGSRVEATEYELSATSALAPIGNIYDWNGNYPMPNYDAGTLVTQLRTDQAGAYSALRLSLADPLKLIAGVRYSIWKADGFDWSCNAHYEQKATTPYAGLIYDIGGGFSTFASYTEIFTPQNARNAGGSYLDPVTGKSEEIGLKGEHFQGRLNSAITLYSTQQDNVAVADMGAPLLPDGSQPSLGVDGARSQGVEVDLAGELAPGWNTQLGYSYSHIKDANGNSINTYIPRSLLRLFTTWKPATLEKLTVGGGADWQSRSHVDTTCPGGTCDLEQNQLWLLSLMAKYQFTPAFSAQLNAENLLDKNYYVLGEYDSVNYAPPRNATLSLKYQF